jgi:fructose-bisphosphate aldolase class II
MIVHPKTIYKNCYGKYAIPAINVFTMEQIYALFRSGQNANAPFIVQITPVAREYVSSKILISIIDSAAKLYPNAVYFVHLDHGNEKHAISAIESNKYNSVMIDASHDDFENNINRTKSIVDVAHKKNIFVEAELGVLSGKEDDISIDEEMAKFTQPSEVYSFVSKTQCDSLAVAVGTSHGAYKFQGKQGIQFDILKEIQRKLPEFPIVLHGGSAINIDEVNRINENGGKLSPGAAGVPSEEIMKAISYGVCKINIATDLRLLWTRVHREFFNNTPELFDPILPGKIYMDEFEKFMIQKFDLMGASGKACNFI